MSFAALGPMITGSSSGAMGGGMTAAGGQGGFQGTSGASGGGGMFSKLFDKALAMGEKIGDRASGAQLLSDMDSIAQGNAAAQLAAGQAMASGANIRTPGAEVIQNLTPQDSGASMKESDALAEFKARRDAKEKQGKLSSKLKG